MNISSINAFNGTFTAKKAQTGGKYAKQNNNDNKAIVAKTLGVVGVGSATALAILIPSCNSNSTKPVAVETKPTTAIVETQETLPLETQVQETKPSAEDLEAKYENMAIEVLPQQERSREKFHTVKPGEMLTNIVIEYAELDDNYPYEKLIPYIERLKIENPILIQRKIRFEKDGVTPALPDYNLLLIEGKPLKVDSILPENIVGNPINTPVSGQETEPIETEETEPIQITSDNDIVNINGNIFTFDLGTKDRTLFGDYEGLMFGKYAVVDKKSNGNIILTKYDGIDSKSNVSQQLTYDKDGKIIEVVDYQDNKPAKTYSYTYKMDSTIETVVDKKAKSNLIDKITTIYDNDIDFVHLREFSADGETVATFDFVSGTAQIGDKIWILDNGSFVCDDDAIGSKKYCATSEGKIIRFDVLKNGFCVEYLDRNGEIVAREQFDIKGNLILSE